MISTLTEATPDWLTDRLREAGTLATGQVIAVDFGDNAAFNSSIAHLRLTYSSDVPANAPDRLLLKLNSDENGELEILFYDHLLKHSIHLPMLVPCYGAAYEAETGKSYLLIANLSETHANALTREQILALNGVATDEQLNGMIDALAEFHAYWWEHDTLGSKFIIRPWYSDAEAYQRHIERRQREWAAFQAASGHLISDETRRIYESTLAKLPRLWESFLEQRILPRKNITLSNGDCYFAQFLSPKHPADRTYIIDFQAVSANFGAYDLVYMLPTFWTRAQRQENQRERRLLERYHRELVKHGVRDYSAADVLLDYRYMLIFMIFDAVWNATSGSPEAYWKPKMDCLIAAYQDLDCESLLT